MAAAGQDDGAGGMTADEVAEAADRLAELERKMQEVDAATTLKLAEMERHNEAVMAMKLQELDNQREARLDEQMSAVTNRYEAYTDELVTSQQTNILRINKVIREVSRGLGTLWKPVFQEITASVASDVVNAEIEKIERCRPFMQAYSALTAWKRLLGDELTITQLSVALDNNDLGDLAQLALKILDSDAGALLKISGNVGGGVEGGRTAVQRRESAASDLARRRGERVTGGTQGASPHDESKTELYLAGSLGDRTLMKIAQKIGDEWRRLGDLLKVPTEELDHISESRSAAYQAAYRVLRLWRDAASEGLESENVRELAAVLNSCGKPELAATLNT